MLQDHIEAVTVCIGYADFLAETIIWNRNHFDKWVIVTSPADIDTRELCRKNDVQCLITEDATRDGEFSKGRLVERGLQQLRQNSWIMHIDADIVLPMNFRKMLDKAHLKKTAIHGFDRFMVDGYDEWEKLQKSGWIQAVNPWPHSINIPNGFKLGARWSGQDGWVPIGYAQMWQRLEGLEEWKGVRMKPYPFEHGSACRTDVQFSLQWDRRERILVPEIFVAHLGSEGAHNGVNWKGRKSSPFKPDAPVAAQKGYL